MTSGLRLASMWLRGVRRILPALKRRGVHLLKCRHSVGQTRVPRPRRPSVALERPQTRYTASLVHRASKA
eukprot:3983966-Pleurochrysis_carterae.AAC.1